MAHLRSLSTKVSPGRVQDGAPTAPVNTNTIPERRDGRTHCACRQKHFEQGRSLVVVGCCLWTALKRQSVKASKRQSVKASKHQSVKALGRHMLKQ